MNISAQFRFTACVLALAVAPVILGQDQQPAPATPAAPPSASPTSTTTSQSATTTQTTTQINTAPVDTNASRFPPILEDGGISIQLIGWLTDAKPVLQGGASSGALIDTTLGLPHESKPIPGVEVSLPAGAANSVRFTYFRLLGQGDTYAPAELAVSGVGFNAGDLLNAAYTLQMIKGSWDFLTYTFDAGRSNLRLKTLWGVQYIKFNSLIDDPQLNLAALAVGNAPQYTTVTEKNFVYPSLGIGLEQQRTRFFRWEASVSGFGIPHHAGLLDGEANAVLRAGKVDVLIGAKYFYFKTSPQSDEYFHTALWGPSIALRWYYIRGGQ